MSNANGNKWPHPAWVAVITAIIAAIPPGTAAVHGYFSKAKEIEIAQRDQNFKIRTGLIDRAVDQRLPPSERKRLFRYLAENDEDKALKRWAVNELKEVNDETETLRSMLGKAEGARAEADKKSADLKRKLATSQAASRDADETKAKLADAKRAYESANADIADIKAALGDVPPERLESIRAAQAIIDDSSLRAIVQAATRSDRKVGDDVSRPTKASGRDRQILTR